MQTLLEIDEMAAQASYAHPAQYPKCRCDPPMKKLIKAAFCLKCCEGGDVLICNHSDCPIVVHQNCMTCSSWLNDSGDFYCPYCLYKKSLVECQQAREKVLSAKNALLCFLDMKAVGNTESPQDSMGLKTKRPDSSAGIKSTNLNTNCPNVESNKGNFGSMLVEDSQQVGSSVCQTFINELAERPLKAPDKEFETPNKLPGENLNAKAAYQNEGNGEKEHTKEEPQQTSDCFMDKDSAADVHEGSEKGNHCLIQDDYFLSHYFLCQKEVNSDNVEEPVAINDEKEQTEEEPQKTLGCLTGKNSATDVHEESKKGDYDFSKHDYFASRKGVNSDNLDESAVIGDEEEQTQEGPQKTLGCLAEKDSATDVQEESEENCSPIRDDYVTSPKQANSDNAGEPAKITDENIFMVYKESGNVPEKQQLDLKIDGSYEGVQKKQKRSNPQDAGTYLTRKKMNMYEQYSDENDCMLQDDNSLTSEMAVHSEAADQPAGDFGEGHYGCEEHMAVTPKIDFHAVKEDIMSMKDTKSENLTMKDEEIAKIVEGSHIEGEAKKQLLAEPQESFVCLKRKENTIELHIGCDKGNDSIGQDIFHAINQVELKLGDAVHLAENRVDHVAELSKDVLRLASKNCVYMTHEEPGTSLKNDQGSGAKAEKHHLVEVEKEQSQLESQWTTTCLKDDGDASTRHEVSEEANDSVFQEGYFVGKEMVVNARNTDLHAESELGREDEREKVKLPTNVVSPVRDAAVHENSDSGECSPSIETSCMGHGVSSKRKSDIPDSLQNVNQPTGLSESSEYEFSESEECEEAAHGKSGQKVDPLKKIKLSTLPSARRKKLSWTVEEVEMLKEGVRRFSSTVKKNLPWTKILELGRHIFDGTRTPGDLRDKWRHGKGKGR